MSRLNICSFVMLKSDKKSKKQLKINRQKYAVVIVYRQEKNGGKIMDFEKYKTQDLIKIYEEIEDFLSYLQKEENVENN